MIGLDTNVLIRYLVKDDPAQVQQVRTLMHSFSADDPGFVSLLTLAETAWVLTSRYGFDRQTILSAVAALLHTQELVIERAQAVREALHAFEDSRAGFSDCLIAELGRQAGCEHTVTFDRDAAKLPGMKLLA